MSSEWSKEKVLFFLVNMLTMPSEKSPLTPQPDSYERFHQGAPYNPRLYRNSEYISQMNQGDYLATLKFAYLPNKIEGKWIWLKEYTLVSELGTHVRSHSRGAGVYSCLWPIGKTLTKATDLRPFQTHFVRTINPK
jgi:hypothetical protein